MIVFDDADLEAAAPKVEKALTTFAGQFCMTGSRLLVQGGVADRFRTLITKRLKGVKAGPASDPSSDMGPLIDKANVLRVNKMVDEAIAAGALGGHPKSGQWRSPQNRPMESKSGQG
jgi:betaine-aldehyde dehydrogenase